MSFLLKTARDAEPGTSIGKGLKSFGPSLKKKTQRKKQKTGKHLFYIRKIKGVWLPCVVAVYLIIYFLFILIYFNEF